MKVKLGVMIVACLTLCACASGPREIAFPKSQTARIRTIGVLTPAIPSRPRVWRAGDIGASFGLLGALVDGGIRAHRDRILWKSMDGAASPPRAAFVRAVTAALRREGFAVRQVVVVRRVGNFLKTYPKAGGHVDAYLDVVATSFATGFGYGYVSAGAIDTTPFRPFVYLKCRLVRASDGAVLMQRVVLDNPVKHLVSSMGTSTGSGDVITVFNPIKPPKGAVLLPPSRTGGFKNFDALTAAAGKARAGMDHAFARTAGAIAHLLR